MIKGHTLKIITSSLDFGDFIESKVTKTSDTPFAENNFKYLN